jgi:hypothetical protein
MIPSAPRQSLLGALRESSVGVRRFQSVRSDIHSVGAGMCPSYSVDSDILAFSFLDGGPGATINRKDPTVVDTDYGKEYTTFNPTQGQNGGSCWCPTNNKFYQGTACHGSNLSDAPMVVVFDPDNEQWEMIRGFTPSSTSSACGRAIWVPTTGMVWVSAAIGNPHRWAIIDPSDNSVAMLDDASLPAASDECLTATELWVVGFSVVAPAGFKIYRINVATQAATLVVDEATFEAFFSLAVTAFTLGAIEYISSLGQVWCLVSYHDGSFTQTAILRINSTTGALIGLETSLTQPDLLYYSSEFDRVLLSYFTSPVNTIISINPSTLSGATLTTNDRTRCVKGCYVDSQNKVALAVQTGPGGGRYETVKLYTPT